MPAGDSDDEDSCEERGIWLQSLQNGSGRTTKPDRATTQSHNSNILAKLQDTRQYIDEVTSFFALRSLTYLFFSRDAKALFCSISSFLCSQPLLSLCN
jgi:hypothetical protein